MGIKHKTTGLGTYVTVPIWDEDHVIEGDLPPETTLTYDLGSATKVWAEAYIKTILALQSINADSNNYILFKDSAGNIRARFSDLDLTTFQFKPEVNNTGKLGDVSYKIADVYCTNLHTTNIDVGGAVISKCMLFEAAGKAYNPGDTSDHNISQSKTKISNNYFTPSYCRVVCYASGDNAAAGKIVRISSTIGNLCSVTWDGTGAATRASAWTAISDTSDLEIWVRYKCSDAAETLTIYNVALEMR